MAADDDLSRENARSILKLGFSKRIKSRMHELANKNQDGALSKEESDELDSWVKVGDLLAILHSKARKILKRKPGER